MATTVFFDKKFAHFVKTLCEDKNERTNKSVFANNYDLMIFAAMVGKHFNRYPEICRKCGCKQDTKTKVIGRPKLR